MPKVVNHPVRLARISAGMSLQELAVAAGITRATLAAIEDLRTAVPSEATLEALAAALGRDSTWMATVRTFTVDPLTRLDARGALAVSLPPAALAAEPSFRSWREKVARSPTGFASLTGVHRSIVSNYEQSLAGVPMPESIMHALFRLGMTSEQVLALSRLPGGRD